MIYFQFCVVVCWFLVVADHNIGAPSKVFDSKNKDDIDYSWYVSKKRCRHSTCRLHCAAPFFSGIKGCRSTHATLMCDAGIAILRAMSLLFRPKHENLRFMTNVCPHAHVAAYACMHHLLYALQQGQMTLCLAAHLADLNNCISSQNALAQHKKLCTEMTKLKARQRYRQ